MAWFLQHAHAVINTFHNCARHQCAIGPSKVVWQECFLGSLKEDRLIHTNPDDVVMNVGQFRSATLLGPYRVDHLFRELSLRDSAMAGYQQRQEKKNGKKTRTKSTA